MIQTTAGVPFEALVTGAGTGLVGTITVEVYDPGPPVAVIIPAKTTGIVEVRPGTYQATLTVNVGGSFMVRWVAPIGSVEEELIVTAQQLVVVSGGYATTAELRAQDQALADPAKFPDAQLDAMRALVEQSLEDACDVAFIPREAVGTVSGDGSRTLVLGVHKLRSVSAVVHDGQALDLAGVKVSGRLVWRDAGWPEGVANLTVTYTHGYDAPPLRVKRAALILAKVWLLTGPVDDRATQFATVDGSTVNLATPGVLGSTFGVPEVDAVVRQYRVPDARLT